MIRTSRSIGRPMALAAAAIVFAASLSGLSPAARADLLPSPFLPLSNDTINSANAFIGGTVTCGTEGSYNEVSFDLMLTGECLSTGLQYDDGTVVLNVESTASLTGQVDNNGDVIGGTFQLTGTIPGLGIAAPALLASGSLLDAEYGVAASGGLLLQILIDLDFVAGALGDVGNRLYWATNTTISGWAPPGMNEWQVAADPSDFSNFTGSQYFFLSAPVDVPVPGTLLLVATGLALLATRRRRATDAR